MQRKKLLLLIIVAFIPFIMKAEWIPLNKQNTSASPPNVTLISNDNTSTVLKFEISGFDLKDFNSDGNKYQLVDLLAESFVTKPGMPGLPYIAKTLAIPDQAAVSFEILGTSEFQTFQNINLSPARESWLEGDPETPYIKNMDVYSSNDIYPSKFVNIDPPSIFRDMRIARVSVFPMRYNPLKKELQVATSITVKINYGSGVVTNPKTAAKKPIASSFGQLYRSFIFNYQDVLDDNYNGKEVGHELMLVIMPDEFYDSFLPYAEWKRQSGIDIHITKFSDIGANSSNPDIIRDHIADAYNTWEIAPTYALLIGDAGIIPTYSSSGYLAENLYVEIEGNDHFPEMMLGRFTNESDYVLQVMVNKFTKYEKTPYTTTTDWIRKGITCSNDAYPSQIGTKRFTAQKMLDYGFEVDTMMSDPGCTYSNTDVMNAINEGRSYLNYRGEGWTTGWWATCTPLTNSQVSNLANGEKLTFVTSIGCGVAMFGSGESFGETWIELGSLSQPRGAACFIGPAGNTHTTYNNKLDKGIYVGMFQEGLNTSGQGHLRGKLYLYNVYGTDPNVAYHYRIYAILGDPSMHIWKDIPLDVNVDYPSAMVFGTSLIEFTVTHDASGLPVENAIVCVTGNGSFSSGTTDASGTVFLDITAENPETLIVTVTGGNVYPFQGTMEVIPPVGPWCVEDNYSLDDIAGGNGNSLMDFGETILLSLSLENIGTTLASDVNVILSTTNPYISITDNHHNYPSIPAGWTLLATDAYTFTVANDMPDGQEVFIDVAATMGVTTWNSTITITGHAPDLSIGTLTISDPLPGGDNNGLLDPGETANVIIPVSNNGSSASPDATAYLSSISSFITLNTNSDNIGAIGIGETEDATYSVTVSPTVPTAESIDLEFNVIAGEYNVSNSFIASVGVLIEDWETGDFNKFPWIMGGNADWTLVPDSPYEGVFSARSGNISDSQFSEMEVSVGVSVDGDISFYRKVSSEGNYDFLKFYIDGSLMGDWDGDIAWEQVSFPVTAGLHTFKWQYSKDGSISNGEDCAWVDYIVFPYSTPPVTVLYLTEFEEFGNIPDNWYNDSGDDFDWTVISGGTPSDNTGPSGDHTSGLGYYMYTEATNPNNPYKRADLITPTFDLSSLAGTEAKFWYHMYDVSGSNYMGTLHLDVFHNDVWIEDVMTPITGNQGNQWYEQSVDLSAYDGEIIELRFRGITGTGYASDMAIDDFSINGTSVQSNIAVDLTVFLEGPCNGTEMSTFLCACSAIPLAQPYHTSPWIYDGLESVTVMPGNVVDWILVELRDAVSAATATPTTIIARQVGLLLNDGKIVAIDGVSPLSFNNTISNNLFTVIHHRNHLSIMSSNAISPSESNYTFDFTSASDQAHGINSQKQLSTGIWGMMSGDIDANGTIGNDDLNSAWNTNAGKAGYIPADLNLDQQVNNMDKDNFWIPNIGEETSVPE